MNYTSSGFPRYLPGGKKKSSLVTSAAISKKNSSLIFYQNGVEADTDSESVASFYHDLIITKDTLNPPLGFLAYDNPSSTEINELTKLLELHPMLAEDIMHSHQRPKLERYEDTLFCVVHAAAYSDKDEEVFFDELHIIVKHNLVVFIRQKGEIPTSNFSWVQELKRRFSSHKDLVSLGSEALLYMIIDAVVDRYSPVLRGLSLDVDQVERQVFTGDTAAPQRIYRLSREVIDFQKAAGPLKNVVDNLESGFSKYSVHEDLQVYLTDVLDHLIRINDSTLEMRELLNRIVSLNSTLIAQEQSEAMKKLSAWAAIIAVPTVIASIYGMNFDFMPELHWRYGYFIALLLMVCAITYLWFYFKKRGWF